MGKGRARFPLASRNSLIALTILLGASERFHFQARFLSCSEGSHLQDQIASRRARCFPLARQTGSEPLVSERWHESPGPLLPRPGFVTYNYSFSLSLVPIGDFP